VRPAYRINLKVVVAAVIAGVMLIGWVSRSTRAQNSPQDVKQPQPSKAAGTPGTSPEVFPSPSTSVSALPIASEPALESSVPKLPDSSVLDPLPSPPQGTSQPFSKVDSAVARPPGDENDDPEKNVQAFVEQNRKVAEGQLKSLKDEAEKLRARLQKVEGGIKRWEALLAALEKSGPAGSSKGLSLIDHRVPAPIGPYTLEPAPAAGAGLSDPNLSEDRSMVPSPSKSKSPKP